MKKFTLTMLVALVLLVAPAVQAQEIDLKLLPDDTTLVVTLDFKALLEIMPADLIDEMMQETMKESGIDMREAVESFVMGFSENSSDNEDYYVIFRSRMSIDQFLAAVRSRGHVVKEVQVAGMTAYIGEPKDDEDFDVSKDYIAPIGNGLFIVSDEKGLTKFSEVKSGKRGNAAGSAVLKEAGADIPGRAFLKIYGGVPKEAAGTMPGGEDLRTAAISLDFTDGYLGLKAVLGSDNVETLQSIQAQVTQSTAMLMAMGSGEEGPNAMAELANNLKSEIAGNKLIIKTGLTKASLDALVQQMKDMFMMFGSMDEDQ